MTVYILATLDTKGAEAQFVRDELARHGVAAALVDTGARGEPVVPADVPRDEVFAAAGVRRADVVAVGDRGVAVDYAARGAARLVAAHHAAGRVAGVFGLGGSAGTTIATAAMRALPLGVPKLVVSTLASGQVRHYLGEKDIFLLPAIVDVAGLNRISRIVLGNAARAMAGLVRFGDSKTAADTKPLIAATMFGVTTPCVDHARRLLEAAGYEVLVFHATGAGGRALETLAAEGLIDGVLDLTTTELADELVGGFLTAGPDRLTAAGRRGLPQVVSVGALDMVNFHGPESVPEKFRGRRFHAHNANVTLMRTTAEESARLGEELGRKVAAARGPVVVLLPAEGVSALDRTGQPFDDPAARQALYTAIRRHADAVEVVELPCHINDPPFAEEAARRLLAMLEVSARAPSQAT